MKRKDLIERLQDISGQLEEFLGDSALLTAVKDLRTIRERLDTIIDGLEEDDDSSPQQNEND